MIQEKGDKHSHGVYTWNKWVLIKPVDACFTGEIQLNKIVHIQSDLALFDKGLIFKEHVKN